MSNPMGWRYRDTTPGPMGEPSNDQWLVSWGKERPYLAWTNQESEPLYSADELAAVTAERDALRKAAENMMLYWRTGNDITVERATIRHDDPIVEAMRAALRGTEET